MMSMKKQNERKSATEANIELNERFYHGGDREVDPIRLIESNMAPVNITDKDE
jgi:hypothetical protein